MYLKRFMGNNDSKTILHNSPVSQFYWACRNGDVESVKQMLSTMKYDEINCLEPNGSTPLHGASFSGHTEIVYLLLNVRGCRRDQKNRYGLTAYEEAYSDEIRQLFHRPQGSTNRFCDENNEIFKIFEFKTNFDEDEEEETIETLPNDKWIQCFEDDKIIRFSKEAMSSVTSLTNSSVVKGFMALFNTRLFKNLGKRRDEHGNYLNPWRTDLCDDLHELILDDVTDKHSEYEKCIYLLNEYIKHGKVEHLLHLYTLETPLYGKLKLNDKPIFLPLIFSLNQLEKRFFQGISYRGLTMSNEDFYAYKWALQHNSIIKLKTFSSTSLRQEKAETFAKNSIETNDNKQQRVLLVFHFYEKCFMAINLSKLSDDLPSISEYEDEHEVLILPWTFFKVKHIQKNDSFQIIYLENISAESKSFLSALKWWHKNWEEFKRHE